LRFMAQCLKNLSMAKTIIRALFAVIAVSAGLSAAHQQSSIAIDELKIRAVLRNGATAVIVPVSSFEDRTIKAELSLAWLSVDEKESDIVHQEVLLQPGESKIEAPLPLVDPSIWTRLRYSLVADRADARSFAPINGSVSLPHIADYVFELVAGYADEPRSANPFTVVAQAIHPISRTPFTDVEWSAKLSMPDDGSLAPSHINKYPEGFVEFIFEPPSVHGQYGYEDIKIEIAGRRGDFTRAASLPLYVFNRLSGQIQSDKPIYQPGQTMHLRAVILNAQGRVAQGHKLVLYIKDPNNEQLHSAQLEASKFGVVHDEWAIPATADLGEYEITLSPAGEDYDITRHVVRISRYELPTFSVTVTSDRAAYLPAEQPQVTVTCTYLFGKPVPKGQVKIVRTGKPEWDSRLRKSVSHDQTIVEGNAGEDGKYTVQLDLKADQGELQKSFDDRFRDIHFAAYYKDVTSGRTEQRRFDIRITREPIHIYVVRSHGGGLLPTPIYISTSYADGRPASAAVDIRIHGKTISLHTNRYGLGKAMLVNNEESELDPEFKATDAAGKTGTHRERYWSAGISLLRLETSHTIHRAGEPVTLEITAPPDSPADQVVMIHASSGDRRIASRIARITNHKGVVTFPYQEEFRRMVVFSAWNAVDPRADFIFKILGGRAVIFPGGDDLKVSAATERATYKPGDKAMLQMKVAAADGKPVEAALGVAIVDQAVLERARTDGEFGDRPWFTCSFCGDEGETEIGGVRLNDLYALKVDSKITPEMELAAEAFAAQESGFLHSETDESLARPPAFEKISSQMKQLSALLDQYYLNAIEFPQDISALDRILGRQWIELRDPWGKPYFADFGIQHTNRTITLLSAGPDKHQGTDDDFVAGTFRRSFFAPIQAMMEEALEKQEDYPATNLEFANFLKENGLLLGSLRDPWGTAYRTNITTERASRRISIMSAGPDRKFETRDDVLAANFSGPYFRKEANQIARVLQKTMNPPQTKEEFQKLLEDAGIQLSGYCDAWNQPYRVMTVFSSSYNDRMNETTIRVFGGPTTTRTDVVPTTQTFITFSLYSVGPDGLENTEDDFDIASFPFLIKEKPAKPEESASAQSQLMLQGIGVITGIVTDQSGGLIPGATVTLVGPTKMSYRSITDQKGIYYFRSVPAGIYSLNAILPGFKEYEVFQVPVMDGKTTNIDFELQLTAQAQAIMVFSAAEPLQTQTAAMVGTVDFATPRVRDYFPETLYWIPEMITDAVGVARAQIPLADTVTTWKVAAVASTMDGRIAESESEFRTFQPFFLDFNLPPVLTQGDQIELPVTIRNYQDRARKVGFKIAPSPWAEIQGTSDRQVTVSANSSANVSYSVKARISSEKATQRIIANAGRDGDAIEKSLRIHPDGQEVKRTFGDLMAGQALFNVTVPSAAIESATRGELRIYPNMASLLLESSSAILNAPRGCAEQTISAGYANLIAWRFSHAAGIADAQIEKLALENVRLAAESLSSYQNYDGGVRYWNNGEPDTAVTAYALSFLIEASAVMPVDPDEMVSLVSWLEQNQQKDGRWMPRNVPTDRLDRQALLLTGTVARSLASAQKAGVTVNARVLSGAYHHIAQFTDSIDEPYMLANFILAAFDSGDEALLGNAVSRLLALGREERGGIYWNLQTNSPFYGWGTAGRYETTSLVVSALSAWRAAHPASTELDSFIRRGLVFLLRGRDPMGTWFSTQSTLRTMRAVADASKVLGGFGSRGGAIEVRINGHSIKEIQMPDDPKATDPILINLSSSLSPGDNQIALLPSAGMQTALILIASTHWLPWEQTEARTSQEIRLDAKFDRMEARAGELIQCSVKAQRIGFRGYGMMLAEIGLPPGAEVDRSSLEALLEDEMLGVDHYEVLPDRVIFYLWPEAGGSSFSFNVSARMPMIAKSAPSILYDYYNPEALSELPPFRWTVK
jgi:hypothetical protein